jgi:2-dehydro-3-deoxyphosphogluconate aldolase / (4S)-4-hydroxy-2-oxoglutarate aldolase
VARFRRIEVILKIEQTRLVPVFYNADVEICKNVLKACYQGGIRVFEFTNRGDFAHEIFRELVRFATQNCPEMMLGAGTVMDTGTAALYMQLGADFIVSPVLNPEVFKVCNRRKVLHIPGCATLSEVSQAEEYGAEIVKIFPGDVLTPRFIKGLKGPMPWSSLMVTGGVEATHESITGWLKSGVTAVGLGSQLFSKDVLEKGDFQTLETTIRDLMEDLKS